jgi:hypothetical protein
MNIVLGLGGSDRQNLAVRPKAANIAGQTQFIDWCNKKQKAAVSARVSCGWLQLIQGNPR